MTATKDDLVNRMRRLNDNVRSFSATVDMTPAVGSVYKGEITEYKDVRAYVLFRRPAEIRIIGLYPVVRSKAFDMVSTGNEFRIYIPAKNRFVEGTNDAPANSANKLENLRPAAFLEAMLIPPPARLQLICFKEQPAVVVSFDFKIGSTRNAEVAYRFDEKPGHEPHARIVDDHKTALIDDPKEVAQFTNELATSENLYLRIRALTAPRTSAEFTVTVAAPMIAAAYANCPLNAAARSNAFSACAPSGRRPRLSRRAHCHRRSEAHLASGISGPIV